VSGFIALRSAAVMPDVVTPRAGVLFACIIVRKQ
jgi:hypothetical protein